jgi:glycosyltransferase involved in cell wall biosynthesis
MNPEFEHIRQKMRALKCCLIIPTYNNENTISQVVEDALNYTSDIIVVADGPTDSTLQKLQIFPAIKLISYEPNRGKGFAIRQGLKKAEELGFEYAITMDSDGQHFAKDIPVFINYVEKKPGALIVGARQMEGQNQNKSSGFANKFSNFWYFVDTFHSLPDTQSGYRLYPVKRTNRIFFVSTKYEFEVEVLVKATWRGIPVVSVPVSVYYPPAEERVSHFRPGKDFTRISILNTYLLIMSILYGHWMVIFRALTWPNIKAFLKRNFMNSNESVLKKSLSVGFGFFMGVAPVWGWQMVLATTLAHFLRLNKAIVLLSANISLPPLIPFIIYISFEMGKWVLPPDLITQFSWEAIRNNPGDFMVDSGLQYLLGSLLLGLSGAIITGLATYVLLTVLKAENIQKAE